MRLTKQNGQSIQAATADIFTQLPAPRLEDGHVRVVVFLDQSFSMLRQKCSEELDGALTDLLGNISKCNQLPGADPEGDRYRVVRQWIDELDKASQANPASTYKVAVIPFSGGQNKRPRKDEIEKFRFWSNMSEARKWVTALETEQITDLKGLRSNIGYEPLFLGTSVPYPTLTFTKTLIQNEMLQLQKDNQLASARIQFIYMSDGIFKPTADLVQKARELKGCPSEQECRTDSSLVDAQGCSPEGQYHCEVNFLSLFRSAFGDYEDNTLDHVVSVLKAIQSLPTQLGAGVLNLALVQIRPDRIQADDAKSPNPNIFNEIYSHLSGVGRATLRDSTPPFSILQSGPGYSYRLDKFYAVNINSFVNSRGELVIDSDGDGVSDQEELLDRTDPQQARTNGVCHDSLSKRYGCRVIGCDPTVELKRTGLNGCEIKSLGITPKQLDNDNDGIPDLYEVFRELNPSKNDDHQFTAGDGIPDHQHFFAGLLPSAAWPRIESEKRIFVQTNIGDYRSFPSGGGTSATYNIRVHNIPLVSTQATKAQTTLTNAVGEAVQPSLNLAPSTHDAGVNQIILLARVVANESPSTYYWLIQRKNVTPQTGASKISLQVNFADFLQLESHQ